MADMSLQTQNSFFANNASEMPPSLLQLFCFLPTEVHFCAWRILKALIESGRGSQTHTLHEKQNEGEKEGYKQIFP